MTYKFKGAMSVEDFREVYDWPNAFSEAIGIGYAISEEEEDQLELALDQIEAVLASSEGDNDGPAWMALLQMKKQKGRGRYCFMEASCDYTGWDCQAWGSVSYENTIPRAVMLAMTPDARDRLIESKEEV